MAGRRASRRRCIARWVVGACAVLVALVAAGLPVYVWPQTDPLRHADAVLILGGEAYERYSFGFELAAQGVADTIVVSNPHGANDAWLNHFCEQPHPPLKLICFVPNPPTTKGEGRELQRLAAKFGWRTVAVVTFEPHVSRARFVLRQCFDGHLVMVASPAHLSLMDWAYQYVYQTAGYLRALVQPGC